MKKILIFNVIIFVFLFNSLNSLVAQEEFLGKNYGLSLGYSHGSADGIDAFSLSAYLKRVIVEGGMSNSIHGRSPLLALIICPSFSDSTSFAKPFVGLEYGGTAISRVAGVSFGVLLCLFRKSDFPCSLGFTGSALFALQNTESNTISPSVSLGYTQAFLAKSPVYPVLGISNSYNIQEHSQVFFFHAGLNVRIGK